MTAEEKQAVKYTDLVFLGIMGLLYWIWMSFISFHTSTPLNSLYGIHGQPALSTIIALFFTTSFFVFTASGYGKSWLQEKTGHNTLYRISVVLMITLVPWVIQLFSSSYHDFLNNGIKAWFYLFFFVIPAVILVIPYHDDELSWNIGRAIIILLMWTGHDSKLYKYGWPKWGFYDANIALLLVTVILLTFNVYRSIFQNPIAQFDISVNDVKNGLIAVFILFLILTPLGLWLHFLTLNPSNEILLYIGIFAEITVRVAILEELVFRDIIQRAFDTYMKTDISKIRSITSLVLVSLFFGLFHANNLNDLTNTIIYVAFATVAGIFYGWAWRREKRLLAAVITHAMVDLLWFTVFYAGTGA